GDGYRDTTRDRQPVLADGRRNGARQHRNIERGQGRSEQRLPLPSADYQETDTGEIEDRWRELAKRRGPAMFLDDGNPPERVLEVLFEKPPDLLADEVRISHARRDVDLPTSARDPVIEFVVLVSDQTLVKQTNAIEHPPSDCRERGAFRVALVVRKA